MSGIGSRLIQQVGAITGLARRGVVYFDYDSGEFVVPVQVSGAPNFEARGKTSQELRQSFDKQIGTSKTGYSILGSAPNMTRKAFGMKTSNTRIAETLKRQQNEKRFPSPSSFTMTQNPLTSMFGKKGGATRRRRGRKAQATRHRR